MTLKSSLLISNMNSLRYHGIRVKYTVQKYTTNNILVNYKLLNILVKNIILFYIPFIKSYSLNH